MYGNWVIGDFVSWDGDLDHRVPILEIIVEQRHLAGCGKPN